MSLIEGKISASELESQYPPRTPLTYKEQVCEKCGKRFCVKYLGKPKSETVRHIGCGHVQNVVV